MPRTNRKREKGSAFQITEAMKLIDRRVAARAYARAGWKVLLLKGKQPIGSVFPHGYKSATTDPKIISEALEEYPHANIGVVPPEGFVVLDCDSKEAAAKLRSMGMPKTAAVATARGSHFYFRSRTIDAFKSLGIEGLDVKGSNGYVTVPPSIHDTGRVYQWTATDEVAQWDLPQADLKPSPSSKRSRKSFKEGTRNTSLTKVAGYLRSLGLGEAEIRAALATVNDEACQPALPDEEVGRIAASIGSYEAKSDESFGSLEDVEVKDVKFLLRPYLVRGACTVLDGDPGQGKSTFTTALAALTSRGDSPPFGMLEGDGSVLFLSAEDDPARVLKPRLIANGAEMSRIRFQKEHFTLDEQGMQMLRSELSSNPADLVVIDPVLAFVDAEKNTNQSNVSIHFMSEIDQIARAHDCAMIVVRHLNKTSSSDPMMRGMGSIAINARVRSGLLLARHPHDPNMRAVAHFKSSYAPEGPTILFEMKADETGYPTVVWRGVDHELEARDLLAEPEKRDPGRPPNQSDEARQFILNFLGKAEEPVPWSDLKDDAERRNMPSEPTFISARTKLLKEELIQQVGQARNARWQLRSS